MEREYKGSLQQSEKNTTKIYNLTNHQGSWPRAPKVKKKVEWWEVNWTSTMSSSSRPLTSWGTLLRLSELRVPKSGWHHRLPKWHWRQATVPIAAAEAPLTPSPQTPAPAQSPLLAWSPLHGVGFPDPDVNLHAGVWSQLTCQQKEPRCRSWVWCWRRKWKNEWWNSTTTMQQSCTTSTNLGGPSRRGLRISLADRKARKKIKTIRQGRWPMTAYIQEFRSLACRLANWTYNMLIECFQDSLNDDIFNTCISRGTPQILQGWYVLTDKVEIDLTR